MSREVVLDGVDPDNYESSLINLQYMGEHLLPRVRNQEAHGCVFYGIAYAAEMQLRLNRWRRGLTSDVMFDAYNFWVDYEVRIGHRLGSSGERRFHRTEVALDIFRHFGIYATSREWASRRQFRLSAYQRYRDLNEVQVFNMIAGEHRPILGVFPVREDFDMLGNQIYQLNPPESPERPPLAAHLVMFMGYGRQAGRPYLLFLNATCPGFGTNGIGRVYFDQVIQSRDLGFYTLTIDELGPSSSAGTPPRTCHPPPPPHGPPPPPGGSAPPSSSARQCASSQSLSQRKNERVAQCSPSYTSRNSRTVTVIFISNDVQEIRLVETLHPDLGAWKEIESIFTNMDREKASVHSLKDVVKETMSTVEFAIGSYVKPRPGFVSRACFANHAGSSAAHTDFSQPLTMGRTFHSSHGSVRRPSIFMQHLVDRFEKQLEECCKLIGELEQLVQMKSNKTYPASLETLPKVMSDMHDYFIYLASKVENLHQCAETIRIHHLNDLRQSGNRNDPFVEADRKEAAKQEAAARIVHPTLPEIGSIFTNMDREKASVHSLKDVVKETMSTVEFAIGSYVKPRPGFVSRACSANHAGSSAAHTDFSQPLTMGRTFHSSHGSVRGPSIFMQHLVDRFEKQLEECCKLIGELEQLVQLKSNKTYPASLETLPIVMSDMHDYFIYLASKVENLHQCAETRSIHHLNDLRKSGNRNDPFAEADRKEAAKQEAAARIVHPTLPSGDTGSWRQMFN